MAKVKKWLETGLTLAVVLIGLIIITPIYIVALCANIAFTMARIIDNGVAGMTIISAIGYAGYAVRSGLGLNAEGWSILIVTIAITIAVGLWDLAAWALWRWKPDWLDALLPDDDWLPELKFPEKVENWLEKCDRKVDIVCCVLGVLAVLAIAAFPFAIGMRGMCIILDGALGFGIAFTVGALAWPVVVLIGWLPRHRKRKFDEFFCAATRNCQVVLFGEVLKDDLLKDDREPEDAAGENTDAE